MAITKRKEASKIHHIKPEITAQSGKRRQGKGFSPNEIKGAGMNAGDARRLMIPVDRKRKTCHEENVKALKAHCEKAPIVKPKPKAAAPTKEKKPKN